MTYNINNKVTVTLTKRGAEILNNSGCYRTIDYKEGDSYSTELWYIMEIFGNHLFNGCEIPFKNNQINIEEY